jgi:hypothetical protein
MTASCLVTFLPVKAETSTIVVPDDYETINAAIANANDGDTVFVRRGTYEEKTLETNKTLWLIGEGAEFTKINLDPPLFDYPVFTVTFTARASSIIINANDFRLSGFTIVSPDSYNQNPGGGAIINGDRIKIAGNNLTIGGLVMSGSFSTIAENNLTMDGKIEFTGSNLTIVRNTFNSKGTPVLSCKGSYNILASNTIGGSSTPGNYVSMYIEGFSNIFYDNKVTIILDIDGTENSIVKNNLYDLILLGSSNSVYKNSIATGLTVWCINSTYYANSVTLEYPVAWRKEANNVFYHNNFESHVEIRSWEDLEPAPYYWDNGSEGNYWVDYNGNDGNADGIGDSPQFIGTNQSDRYPLMSPFNTDSVELNLPDWVTERLATSLYIFDIEPPRIAVLSPENTTYHGGNFSLTFTLSEPFLWIGYSLDRQENVTIDGNMTLTKVVNGDHNLTVYAKDAAGNIGASKIIYFAMAEEAELFSTTLVIAVSGISLAVVAAGVLVYWKKRKRKIVV